MPPSHIAVIGGGITGLSSAFHLSRRFPKTRITLLESQPKLGGWIRSKRVSLPNDGGSFVLEMGPRTLRPNAKSLLELVHLLKLEDKVITVPKSSPAAKTRFLYIPKSSTTDPRIAGLQALPSSILSLLLSPLRSVMLPPIMREPFKRSNRPKGVTDESLDAFMSRRFGHTFAHIFGSALVHGIYATDSRDLSVRAAFPTLWKAEERGRGSVVRGFLMPDTKQPTKEDYELGNVLDRMRDVSVYSFKDGMETLSSALGDYLASQSHVDVQLNTKVSQLHPKEDHFEISTSWGETLEPSHIVSCIPLPTLSNILSSSPETATVSIPHVTSDKSHISSVRVVNLVFAASPAEIHPQGFGYLVPRPLTGYPSSPQDIPGSPGILGTVFDSSSLYLQDTPVKGDYYTQGKLTKLTMMVGGPYPLAHLPSSATPSAPSTVLPEHITTLLKQLERHLKRRLPKPVYWNIQENKRCIPTPLPGHVERMEEMKKVLLDTPGLGGRLEVVGAYVGGVSVGDCVEAGKRAGASWGHAE